MKPEMMSLALVSVLTGLLWVPYVLNRMVVRGLESAPSPWHEMRVTVDGAREWSRRIPTANPGSTDTLDYRFRRTVGVGQPLRLTVHSAVQGALRVGLRVEADEA